jgi:hypothetical protein
MAVRTWGMNANTQAREASTQEVYDRWCKDFAVQPEVRETFALYLDYLVEQNHGEVSIAINARVLGKCFPNAICEEDVTSAVTAAKARIREANLRDLQKVLGRMASDSMEDLRDRAILLLGTLGDLSGFELANLETNDIIFDDNEILLVCHYYKRDDQEKCIKNEMGLVEALQQWMDAAEVNDGYFFRSLNSAGLPMDRGLNQSGIDHIRRNRCQNVNVDPMKVRGRPTRKSTRANFSTTEVEELFNMCEEYEFKAIETQKKLDAALAHIRLLEEQTQAVRQFVNTKLPSWADAPTTPLCD